MNSTPPTSRRREVDRARRTGKTIYTNGAGRTSPAIVVIRQIRSLAGIAAIADDGFYVVAENYVFDLDPSAWGWIHLLLGVVVALAGYFLIAGRVWAGMVAIVLATLSAVANFFLIPYYPFWSILIIALDVWVIWAVTRPGVYRASS
jgi:hypothetical protein